MTIKCLRVQTVWFLSGTPPFTICFGLGHVFGISKEKESRGRNRQGRASCLAAEDSHAIQVPLLLWRGTRDIRGLLSICSKPHTLVAIGAASTCSRQSPRVDPGTPSGPSHPEWTQASRVEPSIPSGHSHWSGPRHPEWTQAPRVDPGTPVTYI